MYSLTTLHTINARAAKAPKTESETTRHCSYAKSPKGIVLHSARHRSTAFISPTAGKQFEIAWHSTNSQSKRDAIVEDYFKSSGRGKQKLNLS